MKLLKEAWSRVKAIGGCLFVLCVIMPIAIILFHFWLKEYDDMKDDL